MEKAKRKYTKSKTEGKITVKHFPNTKLRPFMYPDVTAPEWFLDPVPDDAPTIPYYSVYVRLTVKRQTTEFPSTCTSYTPPEASVKYFDKEIQNLKPNIDRETMAIKEVLLSLNPFEREDFSIKEFTQTWNLYSADLTDLVTSLLIDAIKDCLKTEALHAPSLEYDYDYDNKLLMINSVDYEDSTIEHLIDWKQEPYDIIQLLARISHSAKSLYEKYPREVWNFGYFYHQFCSTLVSQGIVNPVPAMNYYEWDNNIFQALLRKYIPNQPELSDSIIDGIERLFKAQIIS